MSRKPKAESKNQLTFSFEVTPEDVFELSGGSPAALSDFDFRLRQAMKVALEHAANRPEDPIDRTEVAARMSAKLGRRITKTHIDEWTAMATISRKIHADSLKALCEVTGDLGPAHVFIESFGLRALDAKMAQFAEYGAAEIVKKNLTNKQRSLSNELDNDAVISALAGRLLSGGKA